MNQMQQSMNPALRKRNMKHRVSMIALMAALGL